MQLLVLLQVHGELLFATELISKAGSIHHGTGGLVLRHLGLIGHLVKVRIELSQLNFQLPLGGGDGLVDIGQVGKGLVGVSQFLLRSATLAVSGLQKGTSLLQAVLHGSCPPVASNLGVRSSRLGHGLFIDLGLSITHLEGVLLDGGLGLGVACNGVLKGQAKVGSVSLKLLLHPESLSLALGLSLKGSLHGVQGLGLGLLHKQELFLLLSQAALNLLPDSVEFQLAPQHLVLLLLKGGLGLLQSRLKLQLLGLQTLPDFVNLVDGAATLADLVHDVLDFVGEGLVLPADFLELEHSLLVGRLDLEQFRGGVASLLLADVKVKGQAVNLALPLADDLVKLLGLPVHGSVQDLGLVQAVGHVAALRSNLGLGLLHLVQLGVQVVNGSLSQSCGQLHLGHLELLTLGYSIGLILLAPALCLTLSLGSQAENVLTSGSLLVKGLTCTIKLMLQVAVLSKEQTPLARLVVAESLDVVELGSKCGLLLGQDVQVVVKVSNDAEKVRVLNGNLILGGCKVTESQVGVVNLLVDGVESLQHGLVGLVGGGLGPHHLVSGSASIGNLIHDLALVLFNLALHFSESINLLRHLGNGITLLPLQVSKNGLLLDVGLFHILAELVHLCVPLLVQFNLGSGGTAGLVQALSKGVNLPGQVSPLPLSLGASLPLGLQLLLHGLHTALDLLDSLLGLCHKVLLVIELGGQLGVVLVLVANHNLKVPLCPLELSNTILSHLEVALNLPLLLLEAGPALLLFVKSALQLIKSGFE